MWSLALGVLFLTSVALTSLAQTTAGGTVITNAASATYSDGSGNSFATQSNTVSITVSNVSGLAITPDAGTLPTVVAGQNGILYTFTVTNTGNFTDQVRFLASGASLQITGPGSITQAVIDVNNNGAIDAGDTDIKGNASDVISAGLAAGANFKVLVMVNISASAAPGSGVTVTLGDASAGGPTFDNQPADSSAHEVRTVSTSSVNGLREARGDITALIDSDVLLLLTLTAPSGPLALGADITYTYQLANNGARAASAQTLGSSTGIFIVAPIPVGTSLKSSQTFPAGTMFTTSPLSTDPLSASWSVSAPGDLSIVTRVAFKIGDSLAAGASSSAFNLVVTIKTNINASTPIAEIADAFGRSFVGLALTDQSGDNVPNKGDGNANFNEGAQPGNIDGDGIIQYTTLVAVGAVLIGPNGQPAAMGPTSNNDDYSNLSITTGIAGVAPGGVTTAAGVLTYTNTIQNTGNANDTYTITAPTAPSSFTVEVSTNGGTSYTTISGGGSASLAVPFGSTANILVRITAPAGKTVLTGYDTVIRATSANSTSAANDTIDRLYTGFMRFDKTATVTNGTGVGGANDPVPGAVIEYTLTYTNVSSSGGTGNLTLSASNIVITEDGAAAPNNWATYTDHVTGSASDTRGGTIMGDAAGSNLLKDTIGGPIAPGVSGVFKFKRTIK